MYLLTLSNTTAKWSRRPLLINWKMLVQLETKSILESCQTRDQCNNFKKVSKLELPNMEINNKPLEEMEE